MIIVRIELDIIYPYKLSLMTLIDFCKIWECEIRRASTRRSEVIIHMPVRKFKKIFKTNPLGKEYDVPPGMQKFVNHLWVREIITK